MQLPAKPKSSCGVIKVILIGVIILGSLLIVGKGVTALQEAKREKEAQALEQQRIDEANMTEAERKELREERRMARQIGSKAAFKLTQEKRKIYAERDIKIAENDAKYDSKKAVYGAYRTSRDRFKETYTDKTIPYTEGMDARRKRNEEAMREVNNPRAPEYDERGVRKPIYA